MPGISCLFHPEQQQHKKIQHICYHTWSLSPLCLEYIKMKYFNLSNLLTFVALSFIIEETLYNFKDRISSEILRTRN